MFNLVTLDSEETNLKVNLNTFLISMVSSLYSVTNVTVVENIKE